MAFIPKRATCPCPPFVRLLLLATLLRLRPLPPPQSHLGNTDFFISECDRNPAPWGMLPRRCGRRSRSSPPSPSAASPISPRHRAVNRLTARDAANPRRHHEGSDRREHAEATAHLAGIRPRPPMAPPPRAVDSRRRSPDSGPKRRQSSTGGCHQPQEPAGLGSDRQHALDGTKLNHGERWQMATGGTLTTIAHDTNVNWDARQVRVTPSRRRDRLQRLDWHLCGGARLSQHLPRIPSTLPTRQFFGEPPKTSIARPSAHSMRARPSAHARKYWPRLRESQITDMPRSSGAPGATGPRTKSPIDLRAHPARHRPHDLDEVDEIAGTYDPGTTRRA